MPTIAIVDGVRLVIYLNDHLPPHLHAIFAEHEAQISILTGDRLNGSLPQIKLKSIQAWLDAHRDQVAYNWRGQGRPLQWRPDRMDYRISEVRAARYPVLSVTFDDGLVGEYDLIDLIGTAAMLEPLRRKAYFASVAIGGDGRSFGWNLEDEGHEIDFCADAARIRIETALVERLADNHAAKRSAAE